MIEATSDELIEHFGGRDTGKARENEPSFIRAKSPPVRLDLHDLHNRRSIPYSQISYIHFDGDGITISLGTWELKLSGLNLKPLYEALSRHMVSVVMIKKAVTEATSIESATLVESMEFRLRVLADTLKKTETLIEDAEK